MIRNYYFKPRLWPTLMTIPILVILCVLGNWQVDRLAWKLDLIEKMELRFGLPAVAFPSTVENPDDWIYRHITVRGRFLHMGEMPLYSIGPNGKPGYDLFTPLKTRDGRYVIVNRGWVPEQLKDQISRPDTITDGEIEVIGILRKSWIKERFAPDNEPQRNMWYYGNLQDMAQAKGLTDVFPMFLYQDKITQTNDYPLGGRSRLKVVNNHLDYAMTWYGLAIVLCVIYLIFNVRRRDEADEHF